MNCRIHIERLVLDGWPAGSVDREVLAASLQQELEKLAAPVHPDRLARMPARAPTARLAREIARCLDSQLGLRDPVSRQNRPAPTAAQAPAQARAGGRS